jgi:MoaA/NifB/PqqE/SkfB family radical SAM enzyme
MNKIQKSAASLLLNYISNDPMEKLPKVFELVEKLDKDNLYASKIRVVRNVLLDENGVWSGFIRDLYKDVDVKILKKFVECFIINANLDWAAKKRDMEKQYDCNIPWTILMDPTSACNLSCTGCWAAEYGDRNNLSYETLDSIIKQANELGMFFFIFSGGEPLVRRKDIIRLCEAHQDCFFFAFTNGTLVDDELCKEMQRAANFALAFSIEGDEEATDMRRGKGTYKKVIEAMKRMREHHLLFGYSTCYHRYNTESVGSDEFVDDMIARGCRFSWNFTYMPVGKAAHTDLLATPEQRAYMYKRVREIRKTKPIFAIDFWNDGQYTNGCIAGGKCYLHINAAGDVEPCAFIHYSNVNIHDVTLLDALRSPLFMAYRQNQPFNSNLLRPCPLLDNPEKLASMVKVSGAKSTDMEAPEEVDMLCAKTIPAAKAWSEVADRLWEENLKEKQNAQCQ